jgi:hypothetical protein
VRDPDSADNLRRLAESIAPLDEAGLQCLEDLLCRDVAATRLAERKARARAELAAWKPRSLVWAHAESLYFEFADVAGEWMLTFPIFDELDALFDWAAWDPRRPECHWLKTGAALVTSPWLWQQAIDWHRPLRLVETVDEWTGDPLRCSVILQPEIFDHAYQLLRVPVIECSAALEAYLRARVWGQVMGRLNFREPTDTRDDPPTGEGETAGEPGADPSRGLEL